MEVLASSPSLIFVSTAGLDYPRSLFLVGFAAKVRITICVLTGLVKSLSDFQFRDPDEDLDNAYFWRSLQTLEERKVFFDFTGNRFTALHRLPGWHPSTCSPLDAMHLLYLGGMNWIVKQVLVGPGMLEARHLGDREPKEIFNDCLDRMWMPKNYGRLPPKVYAFSFVGSQH